MAFHVLKIRCEECGELYAVRRPNLTALIPKIVPVVGCPRCHPERLKEVCAACRLPFSVVKRHTENECFTCFQSRNRHRNRYKG